MVEWKQKKETIIRLKSEGRRPTDIAKEVGCNISLIYYYTNPINRRRSIDRLLELKKTNKTMALEYKGGKCIKCWYAKCKAALVFHHIDPKSKEIRIGGVPHTWNRLKKELDKTVLLCCRCHTELHDGCWTKEELDEHELSYHGYEPTGVNVLLPSKTKSSWMKLKEENKND